MFDDEPWIRPALAIALAAFAAAVIIRLITHFPAVPNGMTSLTMSIAIVALSATARLLHSIFGMWRAGVANPTEKLRAGAQSALREQSVIVVAVALVSMLLFATTFMKSMITALVPFWADAPLAGLDVAIGIDGKAMANALGRGLVAVGLFYGIWHIVHIGGILWVIHWRRPARGRFILSFMLTWAIGMAAAFIFSSAGPLFTGRYDLATAPDSVRLPAQMLWANYQAKGALLGGGISAFPSLHVAIATWFAMVLAHRGWPRVGIAYAAGIYAGSVILGWHYAADGAGGIAVALLADRLAQRLLKAKPQPQPSPAAPALP